MGQTGVLPPLVAAWGAPVAFAAGAITILLYAGGHERAVPSEIVAGRGRAPAGALHPRAHAAERRRSQLDRAPDVRAARGALAQAQPLLRARRRAVLAAPHATAATSAGSAPRSTTWRRPTRPIPAGYFGMIAARGRPGGVRRPVRRRRGLAARARPHPRARARSTSRSTRRSACSSTASTPRRW